MIDSIWYLDSKARNRLVNGFLISKEPDLTLITKNWNIVNKEVLTEESIYIFDILEKIF